MLGLYVTDPNKPDYEVEGKGDVLTKRSIEAFPARGSLKMAVTFKLQSEQPHTNKIRFYLKSQN